MTNYGILLVDINWTNDDSVQIEKTTHLRHQDHLVEGAKALIYVRDPVDAVVAEAELTGKVIQLENEPEDVAINPVVPVSTSSGRVDAVEPLVNVGMQQPVEKTFRVPLKVVRLKGQSEPIPFNRLQTILGSDFTVFDETWIPLNEPEYQAIVALWGER